MTEGSALTMSQVTSVLDNSPSAVIVSDLETRELLFANNAAKQFMNPKYREKCTTCYQAFGFDAPCPTCPLGKINSTELYTREFHLPESNKTYELSGKVVDWDGRPAHVEYIWDISERRRLERELTEAKEKMEDIINAIPGGVAIYKVTDIFQTVYFSDGVPKLSGHDIEEYKDLIKRDATELIYPEDTGMAVGKLREAIKNHTVADFEFRVQRVDGNVVWVHIQAQQVGQKDGAPLLQCVFHNISAYKETKHELDHIVNSIPGGIACYSVVGDRFIPTFYSDGVAEISGHTKEEFEEMVRYDALNIIYEQDRERVLGAAKESLDSGEVLDISYRMRHKDGNLIWIHLNGRRMNPLTGGTRFYAVFTGMSEESRLFQKIANETADGIYVIDKGTFELLYANESKGLFSKGKPCAGQKCYYALHGKSAPCAFCTINEFGADGKEHVFQVDGSDRFYTSRFTEADWNGIPAYVQYIRDVTKEVNTRKEKERLEIYFKTLVDNLPGGVSVIRCESDGSMTHEFISDGFAAMIKMTVGQVKKICARDIFACYHPDDVEVNRKKLSRFIGADEGHCELCACMQRGDGGCIWVKNMLSKVRSPDGILRLYSVHTDISKSVEEQEQIRQQYEDLILQHYRTPGPNELILGHCNITRNKIIEIWDSTDSSLIENFGDVREEFFKGLSTLVVDEAERRAFLDTYLNAPSLEAFARNETERVLRCFVKLPLEDRGRYVQIKVNMVETPDTGDVTGILTITDITQQTISDRILHQLSITSHDYVVDLDLDRDTYTVLTCSKIAHRAPEPSGRHSERVAYMAREVVAPKDSELYANALAPDEIRSRLIEEGPYTFTYSVMDEKGDIRTKNMTVSGIDRLLGRVCLACTDITESVREQQGLLNMMAYTFELMGFLDISSRELTMYTRQMVLENLPPYIIKDYNDAIGRFTGNFVSRECVDDVAGKFKLSNMLSRLEEEPAGFDFVFPYKKGEALRFKQVNVLWGDQNHRTVCMVRADVTDILTAERNAKKALEEALALAEEANSAKSDFLSAMSHDIRTPMNAIMGMTALAVSHFDDKDRVMDCLLKISVASKHLLSLINDVLDMSRIERSQIVINKSELSMVDIVEQLSAIMAPQAKLAGIRLSMRIEGVSNAYFYGDALRINQILINLLSNAIKFTPEGGNVDFLVEELPSNGDNVRYRFTVSDTGIGMTEGFISHIFDPFVRDNRFERIEGTGLGLSITKGLVELMMGTITVESQINKGTTFRVELNFEAVEEVRAYSKKGTGMGTTRASAEKLFDGRCFLIAEDNAINAEILCELLAMYGARSIVKCDGAQAVRAFYDSTPGTFDAILMDIQMPEMDGYEATRAIRALNRRDSMTIPIIAMTANAFAEDIQSAIKSGMNAHVAKPIDIDVLLSTLSKALGAFSVQE